MECIFLCLWLMLLRDAASNSMETVVRELRFFLGSLSKRLEVQLWTIREPQHKKIIMSRKTIITLEPEA